MGKYIDDKQKQNKKPKGRFGVGEPPRDTEWKPYWRGKQYSVLLDTRGYDL